MTKKFTIGIFGATGAVGNEMIDLLTERNFPADEIRLFASSESAGELYEVCGLECVVEELSPSLSFDGMDIALMATSAELSKQYVPLLVEAGVRVIDNSSAFRMDDAVPLIVPEVNADILTSEDKLIANPNCSTIQLAPVLSALNEAAGLKRVVVSTYQAVSGAGKIALDELFEQTRNIFTGKEISPEAFSHQIAFNCIPAIDVFLDNGFTKEEEKIINESRKILNLPELRITATAVRVPVFHSHAESVNVELSNPLSPASCRELLENTPGVKVATHDSDLPLQINVAGKDDIYVGRIRTDRSVEHGLHLWVVADNLRKGAALNAVQIAEIVMTRFLQ